MKIQTRIILAAMLVVAVVNIIYTGYFISKARNSTLQQLQSTIKENDKLLAVVMEGLLYDGNLEQLNANLDSFFANPDMVSISIREFQGDIAIARERPPDNGSGETVRSRVVIKPGLDELGEVTTAYSTARIEQHLQTSRNEILLFTTILALVLSLVIYYVAKGLTRPIERLTEAARDMANGHLDREIAVAGTYELQSLGDSFIRMRDAIREKMADLAAQNANLRVKDRAIASSLNGLTIADPDGRLIYVNPSFLRLWGYDDPSEVLGKSAVDFWQQPSQAAGAIESLRLNGSFSGEMTAKKKDGTLFPVEISASLMDDEQGRPSCLVESFLDITERKRAEEEQRKLASVVEMSRDMIGIASMDGRVIYMNAAGLCLVGLAGIEAARAAVVLDFFPESSSQQAHEEIMPTLLENNFWQGETRLRNFSTGKEIDVEMAIFLIKDSQGTPFAMATVTRDISERKAAEKNREHLEAQFMQAQKMESVGRLAGGVAHDFNNMLSVILGYTELMKGVLPETNPPMHYLQEIEGAALRSRDLTRQLLAFSRKQAIAPKVVNLNILIEGMQKTLTRMIGEDIDLRFSPVEDLWNITIDPMQVDQIIMNLAVNARDALPNGGTLTLETANLRLDEEYCRRNVDFLPGSYVVLMVSDNGIGMNNEILTHLFEPFFTTKEFGKGTGLGLATVYGIVKQNSGFINVYSEVGHGTTFKIYLPRAAETTALTEAPSSAAAPVRSGTGTILLVEDDPMVCEMTTHLLKRLGYSVLIALSPTHALSLCQQEDTPIDLLLTDVVMPEMNGKELMLKMKAIRPGIRVLFMSGYTANVIAHHGVLDKGIRFIQKPYTLDDLARKVREAMADI